MGRCQINICWCREVPVIRIGVGQCTAAIDIVLDDTTADVHSNTSLNDTILTATEGTLPDSTITDVQLSAAYVGLIGISQCCIATGSSKDVTTTAAFSTDNGIATDVNRSLTYYRTHRTGTIDIANHMATVDGYSNISIDYTSRRIVMIFILIFNSIAISVYPVFVCTATAAIDVTTISISRTTVDTGIRNTNPTAMDVHSSITERMSVLTAAIYRTLDLWFRSICAMSLTTRSYIYFGIINPCQMVVNSIWRVDITARRTEHHTIVMAVSTNGSACDVNRGLTTRGVTVDGTSTFIVCVVSQRTVGTATIDVMQDSTAADVNDGIALHQTGLNLHKGRLGARTIATQAATIDVAIHSTA